MHKHIHYRIVKNLEQFKCPAVVNLLLNCGKSVQWIIKQSLERMRWMSMLTKQCFVVYWECNFHNYIIWWHSYKHKLSKVKIMKCVVFVYNTNRNHAYTNTDSFPQLCWLGCSDVIRWGFVCIASCTQFTLIQSYTLSLGLRRKLNMSHPLATILRWLLSSCCSAC